MRNKNKALIPKILGMFLILRSCRFCSLQRPALLVVTGLSDEVAENFKTKRLPSSSKYASQTYLTSTNIFYNSNLFILIQKYVKFFYFLLGGDNNVDVSLGGTIVTHKLLKNKGFRYLP